LSDNILQLVSHHIFPAIAIFSSLGSCSLSPFVMCSFARSSWDLFILFHSGCFPELWWLLTLEVIHKGRGF